MGRATRLALLTVIGLLFGSGAFAKGPFGRIHVGAWSGGAYTDEAGKFSHCAASTFYRSNILLILGQNAQRSWLLSFANQSWTLKPGETFPIDLTLDGKDQFHIFGQAVEADLVTAVIPANTMLAALRRAHLMAVVAKGNTFEFDLRSTGQLIPVITNCVDKVQADGIANAGDFSILPAKPPITATASTSDAKAPTGPSSSANLQKLVDVNGSGFVISTDGHVLTNNHVIAHCVGDIRGNLASQPTTVLRIVSQDEENDLALLQAPSGTFKDIATLRASAIHSGDTIIAIGYPYHGLLTSDFTVTTGIVSSLSGVLNDTRYLQISAPVQPGNSGGPLLDSSGDIVGVVAEKLNAVKFAKATGDLPENINFAIKTGAVRDFLDNSVIAYQTTMPGPELKTSQVADNARKFTMLISCSAQADASK